MQFPFDLELTISGVWIADVSGIAILASSTSGCEPGAEAASWYVSEVLLNGKTGTAPPFNDCRVVVPDTHPLHDELIVGLINHQRDQIDEAWTAHVRAHVRANSESRVSAGRLRFTPATPRRLVPTA